MTEIKSGFAFHVHHNKLIEWCTDYDKQVQYIKRDNPADEQELRLRLFQLIPRNTLPKAYSEARKAYDEACEAYDEASEAYDEARKAYGDACEAHDEAWKAYGEAGKAYESELINLHTELCPDCPWNGETIFAKEK